MRRFNFPSIIISVCFIIAVVAAVIFALLALYAVADSWLAAHLATVLASCPAELMECRK